MLNKTAIITGATSGIGAAFAEYLASKKYDLIITGRRKRIIEEVANRLRSLYSIKIEIKIIEFSNQRELENFIKYIKSLKRIDILVNNAGFGNRKSFLDDTYKEQEKMITVHINSTVQITHATIPILKNNNNGTIINVSSLAAFLAGPESTIYCATKSFLNTFSKSLFIALKPYNINVQALCPGFTRTDFHNKLKIDKSKFKNFGLIRWMSAEKVVKSSFKNIHKAVYIPGLLNRVLYKILRFIPERMFLFIVIRYRKKVL